jgi:hypothetical protein
VLALGKDNEAMAADLTIIALKFVPYPDVTSHP